MSAVFGVPPPPRPRVMEPGAGAGPAQTSGSTSSGGPRAYVVSRDPQPWRRRGVQALTLVAVVLLVVGHLSAWLHMRVLDVSASAPTAASASVEEAGTEAAAIAAPTVERQVNLYYSRTRTPTPPEMGEEVRAAVQSAVEGEAFATAWEDAVRAVLQREVDAVARGRGANAEELPAPVTIDLAVLGPEISRSLGVRFPFLAGSTLDPGEYALPQTTTDGMPHDLLHQLDRLWWLFLLGGVVVAAAAIAWAPRRLRLGGFLAVDLVLGLGITLLAVPLGRELVGELAAEPASAGMVEAAYGAVTRSLVVQSLTLMAICAVAAVICFTLASDEDDLPRA